MINIVIPMAGEGKRFRDAGYDKPKPLIDVLGVPMIERVISSLTLKKMKCNFYFIVLQKHLEKKDGNELGNYLKNLGTVVPLDAKTEGAASTTLMVSKQINNDTPLVIANCDQYLSWDFENFVHEASNADGCAVVFNSTNPHHSYVKIKNKQAVLVAEKVVISDRACAGIYYYKRGKDYIDSVQSMIAKNIRTNNEFYIAPAYNELIKNNGKVTTYEIDVHKKHMLGTPEELNIFIDKVNNGEVIL